MNDHELDLALGAMGQQRTAVADLPELRDFVRSVATTEANRHGSLLPPSWRFQSLFSVTKFVVAGAIVALFGVFLLGGVLTQQPSEESPAQREFAGADPVEVSVELTSTRDCDEIDGGLDCRFTATSTDTRLLGVATMTYNEVWYPEDFHQFDMLVYGTRAVTIENDAGVWRSPPMYDVGWDLTSHDPPVARISEDDLTGTLFLVGEDGYDGLIAVLRSRTLEAFIGDEDITDDYALHGFIVEDDLPPPPDSAYAP